MLSTMAFRKPAAPYVGWLLIQSCYFRFINGTMFAYVLSIFFAPGFECCIDKYRCMHIVVAESKGLTVVDYIFLLM